MAISDLGDLIMHPPPPGDLLWYKVHGVMLYLAFGILYPAGVFGVKYARYHHRFRRWFQCHWIVQSIGLVACIVAISVALRCFGETGKSTHRFIGFSLTFSVVLQPLVACFRPDIDCEWRRCWENFHWFLGNATILLGWVNVFKGISMYSRAFPDCDCGKVWSVLFTIQVTLIGFGFLYFDRIHLRRPDDDDDCDCDDDCDDDDDCCDKKPRMVRVPLLSKPEGKRSGRQFLTKV